MLNKKREITDINEIYAVLKGCNTIRLGLTSPDGPYIVPLSFGIELDNGVVTVYVHGASKGLKADCMRDHPHVCVEGDIFIRTERMKHGITTRYESVIGFGTAEQLTDMDEKKHGLQLIDEHYSEGSFNLDECKSLAGVTVWRVRLTKISGKHNLASM